MPLVKRQCPAGPVFGRFVQIHGIFCICERCIGFGKDDAGKLTPVHSGDIFGIPVGELPGSTGNRQRVSECVRIESQGDDGKVSSVPQNALSPGKVDFIVSADRYLSFPPL